MGVSCSSLQERTRRKSVISALTQAITRDGPVDFGEVARIVKEYSGTLIPLVKPQSYNLRVCGQDGTLYSGNEDQLESWKYHYLPERKKVQVIGAIDDFPREKMVLLLCEDKRVYAYDDEVLHVVAESLQELFHSGMNFPGKEVYNFLEKHQKPDLR